MKINHADIIESQYLFWGSANLNDIITPQERAALCDIEFYDWISGLYWGEGIAMNYALKMSEISPNKDKWLKVYRDEHKHQTLLGNWFIERGLTPLPKNKLINFAFKQVERIDSTMSENRLIETMYSTQIFFEELFHSLLKLRMKHVKDRDLRSVFYQIFIDESDHLSKARNEIQEMDQSPKKSYVILEENKSKLFPLDIAKTLLTQDQIDSVKKVRDQIVIETLEEAKSNKHLYKPLKILHQFQKIPGYNCVACSPKRHDGLHLEPKLNPTLNIVEDTYVFPKRCEGFNSVVHGGFIGMVLDEMMGYASILSLNLLPLTRSMNVTYRLPVMVGTSYKIVSHIEKEEGQMITCKAFIKDFNDVVYAESEGKMFVPTKAQAPKILGKLAKHEVVEGMFL